MANLLDITLFIQARDTVNNDTSNNAGSIVSKAVTDLPISFSSKVNVPITSATAALPLYPAGVAAATTLQFIGKMHYATTELTANRNITLTVDGQTYLQGEVISFITVGAAVIASTGNSNDARLTGEWFILNITA